MLNFTPYTHQLECLTDIDSFKANNTHKKIKGRIVIPTGGGKTLIQQIELNSNLNGRRIHLVLAPRIALLNQLAKTYRNAIGGDYLALAFHSGHAETDYENVTWDETSTTSILRVNEQIDRAKLMKKDLVIFSTYHSGHKLTNINFYTAIADESQYCVQDNFHEEIKNINARRFWFFTATEKHTAADDGHGLNNEEVFGKIIYQTTPERLIKDGIIVAPRIHHCELDGDNIIESVIGITEIHQQEAHNDGMPKVKVLFACDGTKTVKEIYNGYQVIKNRLPNFDVFTITSSHGVWINHAEVSREDFLLKLAEADNAIIAHYDILSEGIDVDGISGVVLMRNLSQSKLIQTIGRAVRLFKVNNKNIKKYALITVISYNGIHDNYEYVKKIINLIRMGGYDINFEDIIELSPGKSDKDEEIDDQYKEENTSISNSNISLRHFLEEETMFDKLFKMLDNDVDPSNFNLAL